jgi:hypothetical protein
MDETPVNELKKNIIYALDSYGYKPRVVPQGNVRQLRGGLTCVDLEEGGNIDSALLMAKGSFGVLEPRFLYRIDYAIRGNIQGIPAGRKIIHVQVTWEGFLRKRLKELNWIVPEERESQPLYTLGTEGTPPSPGEVWKGGPHQVLAGLLNRDADLFDGIRGIITSLGDTKTVFNIFSDWWGESLRVSAGSWMSAEEVSKVYTSPSYLEIIDRIFKHLRETRRQFGGLTF